MTDNPRASGALTQQITALRERLDLIWDNHEREHRDHESAHTREHESAQRMIDTAAELAKENKADANEWRDTMNDRERQFATKADISGLAEKIVSLERAEIKRAENERLRLIDEAEEKRQAERRVTRSQWTIGLVVGLMATFGAILINLVIRLSSGS